MVWQVFSGMAYYEPRLPCDATQTGRFRRVLGEAGVEQLLKSTIEASVAMRVVKKTEFERIIVDTTVQEKAIAHPADSRLLEIARHKVASAAKRCGIALKQTFAKQGKELRRKAGGYAHASSSSACGARSSASARSWAHSCAMHGAVWNQLRRALPGMNPRPLPSPS